MEFDEEELFTEEIEDESFDFSDSILDTLLGLELVQSLISQDLLDALLYTTQPPPKKEVKSYNYIKSEARDISCNICLTEGNGVITTCSHEFCKECIKEWVTNYNNSCPVCRTKFVVFN